VRFRELKVAVGGITKADLLVMLERASVSLNDYARVLFADDNFTTTREARNACLAVVSLPEIGLPNGGVYAEILARAAEHGLVPCSLETAPHLRLNLLDQAEGPYLTVASLKLRSDPLLPNGMYLRRLDGRLWLRGYEAGDDVVYERDFTDFVFARG
jgi:hypothetical protein